jgi:hypothetical protein
VCVCACSFHRGENGGRRGSGDRCARRSAMCSDSSLSSSAGAAPADSEPCQSPLHIVHWLCVHDFGGSRRPNQGSGERQFDRSPGVSNCSKYGYPDTSTGDMGSTTSRGRHRGGINAEWGQIGVCDEAHGYPAVEAACCSIRWSRPMFHRTKILAVLAIWSCLLGTSSAVVCSAATRESADCNIKLVAGPRGQLGIQINWTSAVAYPS